MKKSALAFILLLQSCLLMYAFSVSGQTAIWQFVKDHTVPIAAIHPDSLDFSDLEPIGKAIGDARIVMLGEQSHGDGATFSAKARLIKYLYEKKGFNVLAFESDFFALNHGWDQLGKEKEAISKFLPKNIFTIWTAAEQLKEFFYSYIPATYETASPLVVTGFDNQLHGRWGLAGFNITETKAFRKRKVRFTASVRLEGSKENKAFLRLWVNGEVKEYIQIKPGDWSKYEIVGLVGKNPRKIKFDVSVIKGGAVLYIDDVRWYVERKKKWEALTSLKDFETVQLGEIPKGWYVNGKNYMTGATEEAAFSGTKSIRVKIPAGN